MREPFVFADGRLAYSVDDLVQLCQQSPDDGINYLMREDFEKWLTYIGKTDLAQCAKTVRESSLSDRERLDRFLSNCQTNTSPEPESESQSNPFQNFIQPIVNFFSKS